MLESLVTWVLNNYLGKYVENLNTDQLSIAILSGEVELENLPLRKDALRHLGIPVEIKAGHIGKVKLQIPIRSLRSSPWVIVIERLYLIAGPLNLDEWDQSAEDLADQERKLAALDAIEACWRLEADSNVSNLNYASSYSTWLSYGTGVITDIVENMQLHVKDVHIRYEDSISLHRLACVCGLTIESLSAQSCDQNWLPQFTTHRDGSDLSFKTIELKNLAVYWDLVDPIIGLTSNLSPSDLAAVLSENDTEKHQYLISPVSACAKLQRNRSELPLKSVNSPRFICELNLDQVPLSLVDWQYEQMVSCIRGLEFLSRVQIYRRRRPSVPVSTDPKAWWEYACTCHVPGAHRQSSTWTEALSHARENVQYVELYTKLLIQPSITLSMESKRLKDLVEYTRDYDTLRSLREVCMRRCPLTSTCTSPNASSGRSALKRWFPQWLGWYTAEVEEAQAEVADAGLRSQLEDEILEALADSARNNTLLRRDAVFGRFNFMLKGGELELRASKQTGSEGVTMLELQFSELVAEVVSRPRSSAFSVELRLGELFLRDKLTPGTLFPVLVGPPRGPAPAQDAASPGINAHRSLFRRARSNGSSLQHPFFTLTYSSSSSSTRRLHVTSLPLDVVYQPEAVKWLLEFLCAPHQRSSARVRLERTKQQLTDTWGSILQGQDQEARNKGWDLMLDISAPQLILVERFCDPSAAIAVVDLGTLRLENGFREQGVVPSVQVQKASPETEDDDDEAFMTPCSTPPGSETDQDHSSPLLTALSEVSLHQRIYDTYNIELNDIQVLVGRVKDNWRYAHTKGTSSLHILDRFNISLTLEHLLVSTTDPMYPGLTLNATLPRLVGHLTEQKVSAVKTLLQVISDVDLPSPFAEDTQNSMEESITEQVEELNDTGESMALRKKRVLALVFNLESVSLEVQSRGRSIAELQVSGVTASLHHRPTDVSLSLTVLGLLLVDALQTFGPDFELLLASHRHVAMDSMSGSLRDSEPTSPVSPASPDPAAGCARTDTSPVALSRALKEAVTVQSPPPASFIQPAGDAEALICVEYVLVKTEETIQVASIQFNNLDIIANQETIVELVGFIRRVFPSKPRVQLASNPDQRYQRSRTTSRSDAADEEPSPEPKTRTELTFDFHRLNVLLLRASLEDGKTVGRKISTASLYDVRIQATIDKELCTKGSLGGLQVLDLTPEGYLHPRIISIGKDLHSEDIHFDKDAFNFTVKRNFIDSKVDVSLRMASVWYTHSSAFLLELQSCATEFKQYLTDVARSIRSAATDVALGIVHARTEQLAQTIYSKTGLDVASPRRFRRRSTSSECNTPFTPITEEDEEDCNSFDATNMELDVVLDTPVLVLPRSSSSHHVLVAHLGKITISNTLTPPAPPDHSTYMVQVQDMNMCTLDSTGSRHKALQRVDMMYNCAAAAPVLHDTLVQVRVTRRRYYVNTGPEPCAGLHDHLHELCGAGGMLAVRGCVLNDLRVSFTRSQYEQVLDTVQWMGRDDGVVRQKKQMGNMGVIVEDEVVSGVSTLSMDPHVRAKLFPSASRRRVTSSLTATSTLDDEDSSFLKVSVQFEVASFGVELCGVQGRGLVGLSFGDFLLTWTRSAKWENELQVSLRSLLVEDLLCPKDVLGRKMITSLDDSTNLTLIPPCVSKSCPEPTKHPLFTSHFGSLPDKLDTRQIFGIGNGAHPIPEGPRHAPRARGQDLVVVKSKFVDPSAPNFKTEFESMRKATSVDLGAVDVVVSASSWLPLMEFFRVNTEEDKVKSTNSNQIVEEKIGHSSTIITVRSLTLEALRTTSQQVVTLCRCKATEAKLDVNRLGNQRLIHGQLAALQIRHPGQEASSCRGERFVTIGEQALDFIYSTPPQAQKDNLTSELTFKISPFVYVHTKRFIAELKSFFGDFSPISSTKLPEPSAKPPKMGFKLTADACVALLPVSKSSSQVLVLDVSQLTSENSFLQTNLLDSSADVLNFDVTTWKLHNVDFYTARTTERDFVSKSLKQQPVLVFGDCCVLKMSDSLLKEKCLLELRVDKNLQPMESHRKNAVSDMTINCRLSTLEVNLKVEDYTLIKGVLTYNLGEDTEHIFPTISSNVNTSISDDIFTLSSLRIELLDVKVHLEGLSCINFVRSRLIVDSFSDLSQDIDLVSRQILITDERHQTKNVFNVILKPIDRNSNEGSVQAEIHSRKRRNKNKFTVLLNNMRLMTIPDWWRLANEFIFAKNQLETCEVEEVENLSQTQSSDVFFEIKLNITESEVVVVEDSTKLDTNAVILRSTTLLTYRPNMSSTALADGLKPLSCSVNHLEVFSCQLTTEEDTENTALSILDPVTISGDVSNSILEIQLQELTIRVSYRDILLFAAILDSFRKQTASANSNTNFQNEIKDLSKLTALGFNEQDCLKALEICEQLDEAALWLTQNAAPRGGPQRGSNTLDIKLMEIKATTFRLCLIDDCADVDVPLSEVTLNNLTLNYDLGGFAPQIDYDTDPDSGGILLENSISGPKTASLDCNLSIDYYNRILGGWEPLLEPWGCRAIWKPEDNLTFSRHRIALHSDDILDINITDSVLSLVRLVQESWTRDIGAPRTTPRSPFVPYSLRNETGSKLQFALVISDPDEPVKSLDVLEDRPDHLERYRNLKWIQVSPGETLPFSFHSSHSKQRHSETHQIRFHQLCIQVHGWQPCCPVTVDRVGVFFRSVAVDRSVEPQRITAARPARLVLDVKLDGSTRKTVVVRSAMVIENRLKDSVDVKLVKRSAVNAVSTSSRSAYLPPNTSFYLPLIHSHSHIFIRPSDDSISYSYSQPDVPWSRVLRPGDKALFPLRCTTHRGAPYFVCCDVRRERYPVGDVGHTIVLVPALLLVNLLPQELEFTITLTGSAGDLGEGSSVIARGRIPPGQSQAVASADPDSNLEMLFSIENFRCASGVNITSTGPTNVEASDYTTRIRLEDSDQRLLFLRARVEPGRGARLRVSIAAPYWLLNRTGLPLVFRQEGGVLEAAGQLSEHEAARMVAPLLFSLSDHDASPMVVARVGHRHISSPSSTHFCQQFHLRRGVQVRRLRVTHEQGPDTVYVVGIEVRPARGRRRQQLTSIVTISPRYEVYNRSERTIEVCQQWCSSNEADGRNYRVVSPPGSHVPFHWPRLDHNQLLCLRVVHIPSIPSTSSWSGGLRIDAPTSCHVLIRTSNSQQRLCFLHAEVILNGATYCLIISEAKDLPPPLRIDNLSDIAVTFSQINLETSLMVHAKHSMPYSWDEPFADTKITLTAPGGVNSSYDVDKLGRGAQLTYENFIYVAFIGTFSTEDDLDHYNEEDYSSMKPGGHERHLRGKQDDVRLQRLVLDVPEGSCCVVLARKQPGKKSQLWRMTSTGQLQHEGSCALDGGPLVLDIEAPAPQPSAPSPARLSLRRPDPRRKSTQTWRFAQEGRLFCAHRNTCVQAQDGLLGLRAGTPGVLGPISPSRSPESIPLEQHVSKQRMRPGSGLLAVEITTDGPTRVIRITDMKTRDHTPVIISNPSDWQGINEAHHPVSKDNPQKNELQVTIMLRSGLGISLIGNKKEISYLQLNNIISEIIWGAKSQEFCISVQDMQCDNQLDNSVPVMVHARVRSQQDLKKAQSLPVLELRAEMNSSAGSVLIFKHFIVCLRPLAIHLEENLLLRMYEFYLTTTGEIIENEDEDEGTSDLDTVDSILTDSILPSYTPLGPTTRYHFGIIRLVPGPIHLSVHTYPALSPRLRALKRHLGLTLLGFEDAPVELEPYVRHHPFETAARLRRSVLEHFREELLWQAAVILGSVDFLGSPLGLLGDVSQGVSGLIRERSVGALVLNVAHGISNSAAKVTETLGDGLGRVTMDDAHEEMRQRIRRRHGGSGGDHIVAGIKGLGFGILGGATGIFKQVYEGAASDGLQGVFSGLGKGLVGAVAKPVVGVLDLATQTARAVRDSSRGSGRLLPDRRRQPRATIGPGGLLPRYSLKDSLGQAHLVSLACNDRHYRPDLTASELQDSDPQHLELYVAYEAVRCGPDGLRVMVSSDRVRVVTASRADAGLAVVTETPLRELLSCLPLLQDGRHYIEMTVLGTSLRRPLIRCDSEDVAKTVTRQINYAKRLYEEATHTLRTHDE